MAKLAPKEEKTFSPISQKLIDAVSSPAQITSSDLPQDEPSDESDLQLEDTHTEIDTIACSGNPDTEFDAV